MEPPQYELLVSKGAAEVGRWSLSPGLFTLGRSPECSIPLEGSGMEDEHAQISISDDGRITLNVGPAGASVEGASVTGSIQVQPDQYIDFGSVSLVLQPRDPSEVVSVAGEAQEELPSEFRQAERYQVGSEIAKGGMGAILNARQSTIRREVAMKVILGGLEDDPWQRLRFIEEAQVTGQLEHPNIVPVHDAGIDASGHIYYTMKLVKGITLKKVLELLKKGEASVAAKYSLPNLLTVYQKVCDAVAFAHSRGVIHRDLKPQNIMIGAYGEVLVMDWGLARLFRKRALAQGDARTAPTPPRDRDEVLSARSDQGEDYVTMAGTIMGTPAYMSPEQARGELDLLDERTDIFSLGVILYEILTLSRPFIGKGGIAVLKRIQSGQPPLPPAVFHSKGDEKLGRRRLLHVSTSSVPESLSAVTMRALEHQPAARYQKVEALQADLTAYQNGFATTAEKAGTWKQITLLVKRHRAAALGIAAVLLVGGVLGAKAILEGRHAAREAIRAQGEAERANRALAELKKSAPSMRDLADSEANFQRFPSALAKLDGAIMLAPEYLPAYWRRAWLLIGMERFPEAAEAIRIAQRKDPSSANLAAILPTVEQLGEAPPAERWTQERASTILAHLKLVRASGETVALSEKFKLGALDRLILVNDRLQQWFGDKKGYAVASPTGEICVGGSTLPNPLNTLEPFRGLPINDLAVDNSAVGDLEPLRGMPLRNLSLVISPAVRDLSPLTGIRLESLDILRTSVVDLTPLVGMPLRKLKAGASRIANLAPLHGMPLDYLDVHATAVEDLSPLRGMSLRFLNAAQTKVTDLSPLQGMPLEELLIFECPAHDFSALRGLPLKTLRMGLSDDFSPLTGMKLKYLEIGVNGKNFSTLPALTVEELKFAGGAAGVVDLRRLIGTRIRVLSIDGPGIRDLRPLLECTELEVLKAKDCLAPIEPLRAHKSLKTITYNTPGNPGFVERPVEKFWKEYDAQQAAGKK